MNTQESFKKNLTDIVKRFIAHEDDFTDDVQLEINTSDMSLSIADPEQDLPECDYYPMMDLVRASAGDPGKWEPDTEAIEEITADYFTI